MPNPLSNVVLSGTDYSDAATITGVWGHPTNGRNGGGTYDVSNGSVFYQLLYNTTDPRAQPSGFASSDWGPEVLLRPSQGIIPAIAYGIRFRNVDARTPATVNAYLAPPGQPALQINSTNDVTSTVATTYISGIIPATGTTPTAPAVPQFTYSHTNGSGVYVVTFNNATFFSTLPVLDITLDSGTHNATPNVSARSTGGFTVTWAGTGGAVVDVGWEFTAQVCL